MMKNSANRHKDDDWYSDGNGYERRYWPEHPMALNAPGNGIGNGHVHRHWHEFYVANDHNYCIFARQSGATIHHKDGNRSNNDPDNLELRWRANHPRGISIDDMVDVLKRAGYRIQGPDGR